MQKNNKNQSEKQRQKKICYQKDDFDFHISCIVLNIIWFIYFFQGYFYIIIRLKIAKNKEKNNRNEFFLLSGKALIKKRLVYYIKYIVF